MIIAYAGLAMLVIALLFRRDFSAVNEIRLRGSWLTVAVFGLLFATQLLQILVAPAHPIPPAAVMIGSQVVLLAFLLANLHIPGMKLLTLGLGLNLLVMSLNGGWMPVTPATHEYVRPDAIATLYSVPLGSKNIVLERADTTFWFLSDILRLPLPWRRYALSIGDVFLLLGIAEFLIRATSGTHFLPKRRRRALQS
ncbi:MAG: DUF5317 domain-containing protein [Caldilineaceae bacterium]|nr:DUF5317 domain-containing protein [Caldilineaceae bacterium]